MFDWAWCGRGVLAVLVLTLAAGPAPSLAQTEATPRLEDLQDVPPPPDVIRSGEPLEPEVTIVRRGDDLLEEHRIAGRLFMVKVTPSVGPSYYLRDQDGDGKLELRTDRLDDYVVPQWVLFSW